MLRISLIASDLVKLKKSILEKYSYSCFCLKVDINLNKE